MKERSVLVQSINRWGNGQGIRLPKTMTRMLGLSIGDQLQMEIVDGSIVLTPTKRKAKTLTERFEGYNSSEVQTEYWTDGPVGKEVF